MFMFPTLNDEMKAIAKPFHIMFGSWMYVAVGVVCLVGMQEKLTFYRGERSCDKWTAECVLGNYIGVAIFCSMMLFYVSVHNFNRPICYTLNGKRLFLYKYIFLIF